MLALHPPVDAPIVRPFHYAGSPFVRGHHRGIDFGARSGTPVGAPCSGRVVYAGPSPAGATVTLACAGRRVTLLPISSIRLHEGARVAAGTLVGAVARNGEHEGLHLGVRESDDRLAYLDPVPLLADGPAPPVTVGPPPSRRTDGRRRDPRRGTRPATPDARAPRPKPISLPRQPLAPVSTHARPVDKALAPWPAWLGLTLALVGAFGTNRRRRRRRPASTALAIEARAVREARS